MGHDADPPFLPRTLASWADVLAKAGAAFVFAFGVYQFLDAKQAARVAATQTLMHEYSTGELQAARETILRTVLPHLPTIERLQAAGAPPAAQVDLVRFLVNETRGGTGLGAEIDMVLDFAGRLVVCVEQEVCDKATAVAYFQPDYTATYTNFAPYIALRRENFPQFAQLGEILVGYASE